MKVRGPMARSEAEALAIQVLSFIAVDAERLARFLAMTGLDPTEIRVAASDPGFLTGVLEYLAANEQLLAEFAAEGADPTDITQALIALRGASWERDTP